MIRLTDLSEISQICVESKKEFIKLIDKSKIPTEELKEFVSQKTGDLNLKVNDRKTLCRMIIKHI
jgi:hypothetical protein